MVVHIVDVDTDSNLDVALEEVTGHSELRALVFGAERAESLLETDVVVCLAGITVAVLELNREVDAKLFDGMLSGGVSPYCWMAAAEE